MTTSVPSTCENGIAPTTTVDSPDSLSSDRPIEPSFLLPLRMTSVVVKGYGRGSKQLGIPTANLDRVVGKFGISNSTTMQQQLSSFDDLPTGIYWGFCRIGDDPHVYKTA
jgi:FAD synthase